MPDRSTLDQSRRFARGVRVATACIARRPAGKAAAPRHDLASLIEDWPSLPGPGKAEVMVMVRARINQLSATGETRLSAITSIRPVITTSSVPPLGAVRPTSFLLQAPSGQGHRALRARNMCEQWLAGSFRLLVAGFQVIDHTRALVRRELTRLLHARFCRVTPGERSTLSTHIRRIAIGGALGGRRGIIRQKNRVQSWVNGSSYELP